MNILDVRNILNVTATANNKKATTPDMTSYSTGITVDNELSPTSKNPVQNKVVYAALQEKQDLLPSGNTGDFLQKTDDGVQWSPVSESLPSQTGQSGKFLTTNGTTASWDNIPTELPSQTGNSGKFLTTNGTTASWATVSDGSKWELANFSTSNYLYIGSMDFSNANSWSFLFHIKTGVLDSTTRGLLFGHKTQIYYPNIRFDLRSEKKMLFIIDGYQSDGFSIQSTELQSNTEYWFKLEYAGGTTYNLHQGTTYQNMEIVGAESSSYTLNNIEPVIGTYPTFFAVDGYWNGSIFISDFKIMKDNKLLFDGACVTPPYTINGALSFT